MNSRGQSLVEVLVATAMGAAFIVGAASTIAPALRANTSVSEIQIQAELGREIAMNAQAWAASGWNKVLAVATGSANTYYINASTSPFSAATGTETVSLTVNNEAESFVRYFYLSDIYRMANGAPSSSATSTSYDPSEKLLTVVVSSTSSQAPQASYATLLVRAASNASPVSWSTLTHLTQSAAGVLTVSNLPASTTLYASGTALSSVFDTGVASGSAFDSLAWFGPLTNPTNTTVDYQVAMSNASTGPWTYLGPDGTAGTYFTAGGAWTWMSPTGSGLKALSGYRFISLMLYLFTDPTNLITPIVSSTYLTWSP
ncbi:MAG TPA: hypothetical protein VMT99_00115 [Candidatus Paceibacterota bacterium]|nr:hypothetical protein [Candidatus Paceibacterota bacterium]